MINSVLTTIFATGISSESISRCSLPARVSSGVERFRQWQHECFCMMQAAHCPFFIWVPYDL